MHRIRRSLSLFFVLACLFVGARSDARPDDDPKPTQGRVQAVAMPFVEGSAVEAAVARLEQRGLQVRIVTIAGRPVDIIDRQQPKPNVAVQPGAEVVLFVGIEPFVQTIVPDVRGLDEEDLIARVEEAYVIDITEVDGNARDAGRVVAQTPRAGQRLALRGVLEVKIVRRSLLVPALIGKTEAAARALLDAAGLVPEVIYVPQAAMAPDRVISQDPRTGAEILPGGLVRIQISGDGGALPDPSSAVVPRLLGASLVEAQRLVQEAGLVPQIEFARVSGVRAFTVLGQRESAGTLLHLGEAVHFTVSLANGAVPSVRVPSLLGMRGDEATRILGQLGLTPVLRHQVSGLAVGTVLAQEPGAGRRTESGARVVLTVAARPPSGWTARITVPRVEGLDVLRARAALLGSGLGVRIHRAEAPGEAVDRIAHQSPEAGRSVRPGTQVTVVLPLTTRMPDLLGATRRRALELLQSARLRGIPEGPGAGLGATQVVRQAAPAGALVARGTAIPFQFVFTGAAGRTRVPNLIGYDRRRAEQVLRDVGLRAVFRGGDSLLHRVGAQSLAPGTLVPRGTSLIVTLQVMGPVAPGGIHVLVPSVVNRSLREAREMLQRAGLGVRLEAGGNITDASIIRGQTPAAGQRAARGSQIVLHTAPTIRPGLVLVPDVQGKGKRRAKTLLEAAGLTVKVEGLDIDVRGIKTKVRRQTPAPGTRVPAGTRVTVTLGF